MHTIILIIMIPLARLDRMKERGGNEGDPEEKESAIYDLVSRDWLAGVGGTCVCLHFILTTMKNRQLSC